MINLNKVCSWLFCLAVLILIVACSCSSGSTEPVDPDPQDTNGNTEPLDQNGGDPGGADPGQDDPAGGGDDPTGGDPVDPQPGGDPVDPEPVEVPAGAPVTLGAIPAGFTGSYSEPAIKLPAAYNNPLMELPIDLGGVDFADDHGLIGHQLELLSQNGFVVTPGQYKEFHDLYSTMVYDDYPVFVTVDSVLHVYHLLFDKLLRDMEDERFYERVAAMTSALVELARAEYYELQDTELKKPALHVWAYFAVAEQLLLESAPDIDAPVRGLVEAELQLIDKHGGFSASPIMTVDPANEYIEDYSQYVPRGHYTKSGQRQRYFKAMMWYGRMNMRLKVGEETRMALLITRLCHQADTSMGPVTRVWAEVYDPTAFLVGTADDLGLHEYSGVMAEVYGDSVTLDRLADDALLETFIEKARELPPPRINSMFVDWFEDAEEVTQGFRLMGQRFVLDAYVFTQLLHEYVWMRYIPSGLDVMAALGSDEAYSIQDAKGETSYRDYPEQMEKLRGEVGALAQEDWTSNVYFSWLYTLDGVIEAKGVCFPPFMRTAAWARKDLHSALGSWAELKHDTILYAKQAYPQVGAAPPGEVVHNYVELNPLAFARLRGLAEMTRSGLAERGLLTENMGQLLGSLLGKLEFLHMIAEKELAGEMPDEQENWQLKGIGYWLEKMVEESGDLTDERDPDTILEPDDEPAAIIADVSTDPNTEVVTEVGTGRIYNIYVVVPNGKGGLQAARGGVYSYYEFLWPMEDRLTDERWREMIENGEQPDQPKWTEAFIAK